MATPGDCPDATRLRDLLGGALPREEEAVLSKHLDTCLNCQQTLDALAVGAEGAAAAKQLAAEPSPAESALQRAMQELKREASEAATLAGPVQLGTVDLDFLAPPPNPQAIGQLGPYEVVELLGRGGMGIVLKAFDPGLQRFVAIKVLGQHLAGTELNRKRFIREARAAAAINHENVIHVHTVAENDALPYLVMEYVAGCSLQDRLDQGNPLELTEILRIGQQAATGLAAAHARGLIHRDIKPANLLVVTESGRIKITDFGLARAVDDISLTQQGVVAGTPQYMAPEQARGEPLDHRADLFSLGSVLYALCTGKAPFAGEAAVAVLYNVCQETPRPIPEINPAIPDWLVAIVEKLQAKRPEDRFQSAAEVAELFRQHLAHLERPQEVPMPRGPQRLVVLPGQLQMTLPPHLARIMGREYRSKRTLFGWPLVHVATGIDLQTGRPRVARGVIAIGNMAIGGLAIGGGAVGLVAIGGVSAGVIALGGSAIGLLFALGGLAIGGLALGGGAVGVIAVGGGAIGYYALGGGAWGVHAYDAKTPDPETLRFFRSLVGL